MTGINAEQEEELVKAGQPEPVAAEEVDEGTCSYEDCNEDADYRVEFGNSEDSVTALMCDGCSRSNAIWVRENELLEREVTA